MSEDVDEFEDEFEASDTDVHGNLQKAILDELRGIRQRLEKIEDRMEQIEERMGRMVTDISTIHEFQRTYTSRLTAVEKVCIDMPLRSTVSSTPTPPPNILPGDGKGR